MFKKTYSVRVSSEVHTSLKFIALSKKKTFVEILEEAINHYEVNHLPMMKETGKYPPTCHPLLYPRNTKSVIVTQAIKKSVDEISARLFRHNIQALDSIVLIYQNTLKKHNPFRCDWVDDEHITWLSTIPENR